MLNTIATHDLDTGVCEIAVSGTVDLEGAGHLRTTVLKSLVEQPVIVLLDLEAARADDPVSLLILPTLERRAVADYGLHLRCHLSDRHPQRDLFRSALGRHIPLYAQRSAALTAGLNDAAGLRRLHHRITADDSAAEAARDLITSACERWNIDKLAEDAQIILSELTANAARHARTDFDVVLLLRPPFLHIQVIDSNQRMPVFPMRVDGEPARKRPGPIGGWGLYVVSSIASGCGVAIRPPGKIVWATLRTDPITGWDPPPDAPRAP